MSQNEENMDILIEESVRSMTTDKANFEDSLITEVDPLLAYLEDDVLCPRDMIQIAAILSDIPQNEELELETPNPEADHIEALNEQIENLEDYAWFEGMNENENWNPALDILNEDDVLQEEYTLEQNINTLIQQKINEINAARTDDQNYAQNQERVFEEFAQQAIRALKPDVSDVQETIYIELFKKCLTTITIRFA